MILSDRIILFQCTVFSEVVKLCMYGELLVLGSVVARTYNPDPISIHPKQTSQVFGGSQGLLAIYNMIQVEIQCESSLRDQG